MKKIVLIIVAILFLVSLAFSQTNIIELSKKEIIYNPNYENNFKIRFSFSDDVSQKPVSGRIIIGFHSDTSKSINNPDIFNPQPTFAWDVSDWKPGETIILDRTNAISWNGDLDSLNGWYGVQAVIKTNKKARSLKATGNAVTAKSVVYIERGKMLEPLDLTFSISWRGPKKFKETEFVKEVNITSNLLTQFYGEPDSIQAAVILPQSYYIETSKQYPTVYILGGWESSHFDALFGEPQKRYGMTGFGEEKIFVFINHECRTGYHVFCNSELNGPREETFFKEIIPFIENEFRVIKNPETRFLMGQSSGAWGSLWLLINYPDKFGGAYVGSPDPVDFSDFVGTNIYEKNANVYFDANKNIKYLIRENDKSYPPVTMKNFAGVDMIARWGEQIYSFDAVFSKKDFNGEPQHLFDWNTGLVNPEVAAFWVAHDLSKKAAKFDKQKINLLQNKIHIYVADNDPFGLNRPVQLFQKILDKKGIEADIRFLPEGGHIIWTDEIRKVMHEDMDKKIHSAKR